MNPTSAGPASSAYAEVEALSRLAAASVHATRPRRAQSNRQSSGHIGDEVALRAAGCQRQRHD
jgi:hypothetical protein